MAFDLVSMILGVLGLFGMPAIIWFFKHRMVSLFWGLTGNLDKIRGELWEVVKDRSFPFESPKPVGTYGAVEVNWFVDFLSAACDPKERELLDRLLTRWIHLKGVKPTKVAVPKLGNVILGVTVAERLKLPLFIVRQESKHEIGRPEPFDGKVEKGDDVLLIDDVASDSEFLWICVEKIRSVNACVIAVMVLVNRNEGSCESKFRDKGIPFFPLLNISDVQISERREVKIT